MSESSESAHRVSRRALVSGVAAAAVTTLGLRASNEAHQFQQSPLEFVSTEDLTDLVRDPSDRTTAYDALLVLFARSGIGVYNEEGTELVRPLLWEASPLAFSVSQAETMLDELQSGPSRSAGDYDALFPVEEMEGAGDAEVPAFSTLYAGYLAGVESSGSRFGRQMLSDLPEGNVSIDAAQLPLTTAGAAMMTGEIMGQLLTRIAFQPPAPNSVPIPTLPGIPELPGLKAEYPLPPLPELDGTACSNIRRFVTTVIQQVLSVLDAAEHVTTIPILKQIVEGTVKIIRWGLNVVIKAINIVIDPIMGVLKAVATGVAIASSLLGTLSMWKVDVRVDPLLTRLAIGDEAALQGAVEVNAGGLDDIPWPPIMRDCANAIDLPLPPRTSAGAPVHIEFYNPNEKILISNVIEPGELDETGRITEIFNTEHESEGDANGALRTGKVDVHVTVEREDLKHLIDELVALLMRQVGDLVQTVLRPIVNPLVHSLQSRIGDFLRLRGRAHIWVDYHEHCLDGQFAVLNTVHTLAAPKNYVGYVVGAEGDAYWIFNQDGQVLWSLQGVGVAWDTEGTSTFSGQAIGTYTVEDGVVSIAFAESTIVEHVYDPDEGEFDLIGDPAILSQIWGSWLLFCGPVVSMHNANFPGIMFMQPQMIAADCSCVLAEQSEFTFSDPIRRSSTSSVRTVFRT